MTQRRVQWALMTPDGKPLLIDGVLATIDDETGAVSLDQRVQDLIAEVLRNDPALSRSYLIPAFDLAHEVHTLIQDKHAAGIPVRSPLPAKRTGDPKAAQANTPPATDYHAVIEAVLVAVHSQMQFLEANLTGRVQETTDMDDVRHGRLGQALYRLARMATTDERASPREYFDLVDYIEQFISTALSREDRAQFDEMVQAARPHTALV